MHIFKAAHHERFVRDYRVQMVTAALATSAAPTFFPTHRTASSTPLIDGGIWANNPAGVAAVEAIGVLQWEPREILLLSLSCTSNPMNVNLARSLSMGRFYWGVNLLEIVGAGQASGALGMAQWLLGHERVYRVDPKMAVGKFGLDKTAEIASLKGLGDSEARKAAPALTRFFSEPSEQFVPFYSVSALG